MLLFDFGGTAVKRAIVAYTDNQLAQWQHLPALPSPCEPAHHLHRTPPEVAAFADHVLTMIEQTWRAAERPLRLRSVQALAPTIAVSLACYLQDGQPLPSEMGCYGRLQLLSHNLQTWLADQLSQRLGQPIHLHLYHDGTAAALAYAGREETAVIMLGTAVGVGFPL
jgi:hypothetical protein